MPYSLSYHIPLWCCTLLYLCIHTNILKISCTASTRAGEHHFSSSCDSLRSVSAMGQQLIRPKGTAVKQLIMMDYDRFLLGWPLQPLARSLQLTHTTHTHKHRSAQKCVDVGRHRYVPGLMWSHILPRTVTQDVCSHVKTPICTCSKVEVQWFFSVVSDKISCQQINYLIFSYIIAHISHVVELNWASFLFSRLQK